MTPEAQLKSFIAKFTPEIAALAEGAVTKLRRRLPNAVLLVYDNYNALAIGFGPSERTSEAILSIAVYPRTVNLCFLQAGPSRLDDPDNLLRGSGSINRFIPLARPGDLDLPAVKDLLLQALEAAKVPLDPQAKGRLIIKSVSERQRPRRPRQTGKKSTAGG